MGFFDCLPAYELNRSPRIIAAFEMDFLRNLEAFKKAIGKRECACTIYIELYRLWKPSTLFVWTWTFLFRIRI